MEEILEGEAFASSIRESWGLKESHAVETLPLSHLNLRWDPSINTQGPNTGRPRANHAPAAARMARVLYTFPDGMQAISARVEALRGEEKQLFKAIVKQRMQELDCHSRNGAGRLPSLSSFRKRQPTAYKNLVQDLAVGCKVDPDDAVVHLET